MESLAITTHSISNPIKAGWGSGSGGCLRSEGTNSTDIAFAGAAEQARMLGAGTITSIVLTGYAWNQVPARIAFTARRVTLHPDTQAGRINHAHKLSRTVNAPTPHNQLKQSGPSVDRG